MASQDDSSLNFSRFAFEPSNCGEKFDVRVIDLPVPQSLIISRKRQLSDDQTKSGKRKTPSVSKPAKKIHAIQDVRLPHYIKPDLDILIVGFNPGVNSATHGHHYAGPGNHFWKCLHLSGLVSEPLTFTDDTRIMNYGIGLTNIVSRPSVSSSDLTKAELQKGAIELRRKITEYKPKIVVFNGLGIYEEFSGQKKFPLGKQPESLTDTGTTLYVMPSSSPRGTKWPRLQDKLIFYQGIAHLRDFLTGTVDQLDSDRVSFSR